MSDELVIRQAAVLDPDRPLAVADIHIVDGVIVEVGDLRPTFGTPEIDGHWMIAMPGLVNAHTHSGQHLDRGMAPNLPLDLWLMWVVYAGIPFSPDDSYTLAMSGAIEMLGTGCTAVLDHAWVPSDGFDEHVEAMASAYADCGIRCGLAPMIHDRDIFESMAFGDHDAPPPLGEADDPARLVEAMERYLIDYAGRARFTPMVGPSAPQRCSDDLMVGLSGLAHTHGAPLHTHVLETRSQVVATRERYSRSVVEYLDDIGALTARTSLAHGVWMDADDFARVESAKATVVHNPISNLRCGSGLLPLASLLDRRVSVALGADGAASGDNQNMFEAMKFAALIHTTSSPFRAWPTPEAVWQMCLAGGAKALCAPVGRIASGQRADIVLLDPERHACLDRDALVRSLVFAEHGESVHTVVVDGTVVVDSHTPLTAPLDHRAKARALQVRINESLPQRKAMLDKYGPLLEAIHDRDNAPLVSHG